MNCTSLLGLNARITRGEKPSELGRTRLVGVALVGEQARERQQAIFAEVVVAQARGQRPLRAEAVGSLAEHRELLEVVGEIGEERRVRRRIESALSAPISACVRRVVARRRQVLAVLAVVLLVEHAGHPLERALARRGEAGFPG